MLSWLYGKKGEDDDHTQNTQDDDTHEDDDHTQHTQDDDTQMNSDLGIQENINSITNNIDVPANEEPNVVIPDTLIPSTQATLVDLLVKAFPDSMIDAPKIVIVGSQSSGKTKLIISMIFLRLIHHPHFTDEMGNILLQVFRTGTGLTTRRPITVKLLHTSDKEVCSINFRHQAESFDFGEALLPEFIARLHDFNGEEIFESPLEITIRAFQLPNIQFTDMPGLRARDVPLADSPTRTLNGLVTEWIENGSNTVVAVESSLQFLAGGMETSLLHPILATISHNDEGLRNRSILLLTRCDQIAPEAFNNNILPLFTQQSRPAVVNDLFQYVIAVVNKIEGQPEPHTVPFAEFRNIFDETRQREREIFQNRGNLSVIYQCTTRALYNQIDLIFRSLLSQAFQSGYENMREVERRLRHEMQHELAPPSYLYIREDPENPFSTKILLEELQEAAIDCAKRAINNVRLFPSDGSEEFIGSEGVLLLTEIGLEWPAPFELGNIEMGLQRRQFFDSVISQMEFFLDRVLTQMDQAFTEIMNDEFEVRYSPFHHLHRFENLQIMLRNELVGLFGRHRAHFLSKLTDFMNLIWMYEEPTGRLTLNRLMHVMHEGRHLLLVECISFLHRYLERELDIAWSRDLILTESIEYETLRRRFNIFYERALIQFQYLEQCVEVANGENNAIQLTALIEEARLQLEFLESANEPTLFWEERFWRDAYQQHQEKVRLQRLQSRSQSLQSSQQYQQPELVHPPSESSTQNASVHSPPPQFNCQMDNDVSSSSSSDDDEPEPNNSPEHVKVYKGKDEQVASSMHFDDDADSFSKPKKNSESELLFSSENKQHCQQSGTKRRYNGDQEEDDEMVVEREPKFQRNNQSYSQSNKRMRPNNNIDQSPPNTTKTSIKSTKEGLGSFSFITKIFTNLSPSAKNSSSNADVLAIRHPPSSASRTTQDTRVPNRGGSSNIQQASNSSSSLASALCEESIIVVDDDGDFGYEN